MMKRIVQFLFKFIILFPVILLSFFVWRDYTSDIKDINDNPPALSGIYYFDEGHKLAVLNEKETGILNFQTMDAQSGELLKKEVIPSNVHMQIVGSYQQDKLIIAAFDDKQKLQVKAIDSNGDMTTLTEGELSIPSFLTSDMRIWRNQLYVSGNTVNNEMYIAQIRDGKLTKVILDKGELLPFRPERIREINAIQDQGSIVPIYEVSLINDQNAYISGILDDKQQPAVTLQQENENSFQAQNRAAAEFAKHFNINGTKKVLVKQDFPTQAHYYNAQTEEWGAVVPTPQPVYQAIVYTLNENEVLIVGSTAEDEQAGSILGYIVNTASEASTDVTSLVSTLSYDELDRQSVSFFKAADKEIIYASNQGKFAGMMNLTTNETKVITEPEVQKWLNVKAASISLESFVNYLSSWNAIVINWLVWVAITLFTILSLVIGPGVSKITRKNKLARGVLCQGTVVGMKETGIYVNERPQVRFTVQFEDQGQIKLIDIKQVVSFLDAGSVGDSVVISYDRNRNSAMFVTEGDIELHQQQEQTEQIDRAVLEQIDSHGKVGRGEALLLHFKANGKRYSVPVIQPIGFQYRVGEEATLLIVDGTTRIRNYGRSLYHQDAELIQLQGKIVSIERYSTSIQNRQLMVFDVVVEEAGKRINKTNSLFVPEGTPLQEGLKLPVSFRREDYTKELRLLNGKQGGAKVVDVSYFGTLGERPLAHITVDRAGIMYTIEQSIEPVYGVATGDELWIAYDEVSREAVIIKYSS